MEDQEEEDSNTKTRFSAGVVHAEDKLEEKTGDKLGDRILYALDHSKTMNVADSTFVS